MHPILRSLGVPGSTENDPYDDETYRLWAVKRRGWPLVPGSLTK